MVWLRLPFALEPWQIDDMTKKLIHFLNRLLITFCAIGPSPVIAKQFVVTAVIKDFPMTAKTAVEKDYYLNAGERNGLKKGMVVDASRQLPVYDSINSKTLARTSVKIARLRIIHTDDSVAVARLEQFYTTKDTPLTLSDGVMVGDDIAITK